MDPVTPEVRLAHRGDVDGLAALEKCYFVGNLEQAEHTDGFISVQHSPGWFTRAVDDGGVHVAVTPAGEVVGFIVVTANNPRSLHTTTAKLGARVLTEFEADGKRFHFLAFAFGDGDDDLGH